MNAQQSNASEYEFQRQKLIRLGGFCRAVTPSDILSVSGKRVLVVPYDGKEILVVIPSRPPLPRSHFFAYLLGWLVGFLTVALILIPDFVVRVIFWLCNL